MDGFLKTTKVFYNSKQSFDAYLVYRGPLVH